MTTSSHHPAAASKHPAPVTTCVFRPRQQQQQIQHHRQLAPKAHSGADLHTTISSRSQQRHSQCHPQLTPPTADLCRRLPTTQQRQHHPGSGQTSHVHITTAAAVPMPATTHVHRSVTTSSHHPAAAASSAAHAPRYVCTSPGSSNIKPHSLLQPQLACGEQQQSLRQSVASKSRRAGDVLAPSTATAAISARAISASATAKQSVKIFIVVLGFCWLAKLILRAPSISAACQYMGFYYDFNHLTSSI